MIMNFTCHCWNYHMLGHMYQCYHHPNSLRKTEEDAPLDNFGQAPNDYLNTIVIAPLLCTELPFTDDHMPAP